MRASLRTFLFASAVMVHGQTAVLNEHAQQIGNASTRMVSGAQAIYMLNEGSGTTVADSSGNGYYGTMAADRSPAWTAQGLSFSYGQYVTLPCAAVKGARTIQIWFRYGDLTASPTGFPSMLGTDAMSGIGFIPSEQGTPTLFGAGASILTTVADKTTGDASVAVMPNDGTMYINNLPSVGYLRSTPATFSCSSSAYLGTFVTNTGAFGGSIYALATYPTTLTAAQLAQNDAYVRNVKGLGSQTSASAVSYPGNATAYLGDSRMVGQGEGDLLWGSWPYIANQITSGAGGVSYVAALPGEYLYSISSVNYSGVAAQLAPYSGTKVIVEEGGINDLGGSFNDTQIYSYIVSMAATARAAGFKVVASTVEPTVNCWLYCEGYRQALNASILAGWRAGLFDAVQDLAGIPVLSDPTNKDYYGDGLHETALGNHAIAYVSALAQVNARGSKEQFWLDIPLPAAFVKAASGTQTINLLQIGPHQNVCGIYSLVTQPFVQPGGSALTMEVGDAIGSVTQYAPPMDLLHDGTFYMPPIHTPSNGTVQATFTSTGGRAAPVSGLVDVNVCVEAQ